MTVENDDLLFAEVSLQVTPLLEKMNDLLRSGRISLKNYQYRIDNNHMLIVDQEKKIAENKALLEDANQKAKGIISVAEERAKEIEKGLQARVSEINHLEREAKRLLEDAKKNNWQSKQKVTA